VGAALERTEEQIAELRSLLSSGDGSALRSYLEAARAFPQTLVTDRRPTFMGLLRLDHLFFRLPPGWRAEFHRGNDRFGSDHYPLIATIRIAS
jgi:endonuclease/exonuclease/phosphatase family metal-dependent hydrolase